MERNARFFLLLTCNYGERKCLFVTSRFFVTCRKREMKTKYCCVENRASWWECLVGWWWAVQFSSAAVNTGRRNRPEASINDHRSPCSTTTAQLSEWLPQIRADVQAWPIPRNSSCWENIFTIRVLRCYEQKEDVEVCVFTRVEHCSLEGGATLQFSQKKQFTFSKCLALAYEEFNLNSSLRDDEGSKRTGSEWSNERKVVWFDFNRIWVVWRGFFFQARGGTCTQIPRFSWFFELALTFTATKSR